MLSNKDKVFLAGLQLALKEFIGSDVGKTARAELMAIEKAAGGKERLDNIDKLEAESEKKREQLVSSGRDEAARLIRLAEDKIKGEMQKIEQKKRELSALKEDHIRKAAALSKKERELSDAALDVANREAAVEKRINEVSRKEPDIAKREAEVLKREAEIRKFDDWRANAPGWSRENR